MQLIRSLAGLRVLVAVQDTGSYSAAARSLGMTQSAVSQHVAALERLTEQSLVEPRTRPVVLTVAGCLLVDHARVALARLAAAERDLAGLSDRRHTRVRLGSVPTALATFVPRAVRRLRRQAPDVTIALVDAHMPALWRLLEQRDVDLAVVFDLGPVPVPDGVELIPLFDDPYRVLLPRGHRLLTADGPVRLRDLADETWVGASPGSTWFQGVLEVCRSEGFEPRIGLVSDDHVAVQAFVQAGVGIAVVPGLAAVRRVPGVESRAIEGHVPRRRIAVAQPTGPYLPRGVSATVDALRAVTRTAGESPA